MVNMKEYGVIIGDIVGSRIIEDWNMTLNTIEHVFREIEINFQNQIKSGPTLTVGDEFQCILSKPAYMYPVYLQLRLRMPVRFRSGMGMGEIEEGSINANVTMRGTAFYRAREAINEAKNLNREIMITTGEKSNAYDGILNTLFHVIEDIFDNLTHRQIEVMQYYLLTDRPKHRIIADHFGTSVQSVSQVLIASRLNLFTDVEAASQTMMENPSARKLRKAKMFESQKSSKNA